MRGDGGGGGHLVSDGIISPVVSTSGMNGLIDIFIFLIQFLIMLFIKPKVNLPPAHLSSDDFEYHF